MSDLSAFDWVAGSGVLIDPASDLLARMFAAGYAEAGQGRLTEGDFALSNDRAAVYARARAAELVTEVDNVTHERVETMLRNLLGSGLEDATVSQADISAAISDLFAGMSAERADLIARTELTFAANRGTLGAGRDTGGIGAWVSDGTMSDQPCADANGALWTLDQADSNPSEHPRCGRSFRIAYREDLSASELADLGAM